MDSREHNWIATQKTIKLSQSVRRRSTYPDQEEDHSQDPCFLGKQ